MDDISLSRPFDIVVIGAGPAGSSAARSAAQRGASVLLIDRKQRIGFPVQCAELVSQSISRLISFSGDCVIQTVEKMITHLPDGKTYEMASPGYMLNRSRFDQELADLARLSGAEIFTGTRAVGVSPTGLLVERGSRRELIPFKILIGADGARSTISPFTGQSPLKTLTALQYEVVMPGVQNHTDVYFREDYEGGYAWFFPKGRTANAGAGVVSSKASQLPNLLNGFLRDFKESGKLKAIQIVTKTGGAIPCEPCKKMFFRNILLIGDAAGHAHPITGAGILNAVTSGEMAGRIAAQAIDRGDLRHLTNYEREWKESIGKSLSYGSMKREFLDENWNNPRMDFEELIRNTWVGFKEYYHQRKSDDWSRKQALDMSKPVWQPR